MTTTTQNTITSFLLSDRAASVGTFITNRGNRRRNLCLGDAPFEARREKIMELARLKYPLPPSTAPRFETWSPRHEVPKR